MWTWLANLSYINFLLLGLCRRRLLAQRGTPRTAGPVCKRATRALAVRHTFSAGQHTGREARAEARRGAHPREH